jgi:hypothetical protein
MQYTCIENSGFKIVLVIIFSSWFAFWHYWDLNSGLHDCEVDTLPSTIFALVILEIGSRFLWDPPILGLLWLLGCMPLKPAFG